MTPTFMTQKIMCIVLFLIDRNGKSKFVILGEDNDFSLRILQ